MFGVDLVEFTELLQEISGKLDTVNELLEQIRDGQGCNCKPVDARLIQLDEQLDEYLTWTGGGTIPPEVK